MDRSGQAFRMSLMFRCAKRGARNALFRLDKRSEFQLRLQRDANGPSRIGCRGKRFVVHVRGRKACVYTALQARYRRFAGIALIPLLEVALIFASRPTLMERHGEVIF
jgi:hypothetical protein